MAEKMLVQNDPSSSPETVQRGLCSFYNLAYLCSFTQPQRKRSKLSHVVVVFVFFFLSSFN